MGLDFYEPVRGCIISMSSRHENKFEVSRRKAALRKKYLEKGLRQRHGNQFIYVLKAISYVLGGPLVWIFCLGKPGPENRKTGKPGRS